MSSQRWFAFLGVIGAHAALVWLGDRLPESLAPAVAGMVYLPLWPLQALGLPVFERAASGGWPGPSLLGWMLVATIWGVLWWLAIAIVSRLRARAA